VTDVQAANLRLHGKIPSVYHVGVSYPILVRDGILNRIKVMPFFSPFVKFSSNKALQIQPENIPFCGVYLLQETMIPDGEANAGEPRFRTSARIGISVIIQNNDSVAAEYKLDAAMQSISFGLFTDSTLYNNKSFKIQGFSAGSRQHVFGHVGVSDQETPIAELRFELVCDLGVILYEPLVSDPLEVIHTETSFPIAGTADEKAAIQQVKIEYDMEQ
jgi:hypothetical protein